MKCNHSPPIAKNAESNLEIRDLTLLALSSHYSSVSQMIISFSHRDQDNESIPLRFGGVLRPLFLMGNRWTFSHSFKFTNYIYQPKE